MQTSLQATNLPALMLDAMEQSKQPLFELGQTVVTAHAAHWADENLPKILIDDGIWMQILIRAHVTGCWDGMDKEDAELNRRSLKAGNEGRIFSAFDILNEKFYVITEWDRSVTTVLLASDY